MSLLVALLLAFGLVAGLVGCMGKEETAESIVTVVSELSTEPTEMPDEITGEDGLPAEELSTFESKDPFVQQAVPTETTAPNPTDTTQTPNTRRSTPPRRLLHHHDALLQHHHHLVDHYHSPVDHYDDQTGHHYNDQASVRPHLEDPLGRRGGRCARVHLQGRQHRLQGPTRR